MLSTIVKIAIIGIAVIFILILIVKRFVYFRPTYDFMAPRDNYQDIKEGNIHAWYKKGKTGKLILFCHGNAGNLSYRQGKLAELIKMGHSVLIFDYNGFGQSRGVPNEDLCYRNASMMVDYAVRHGYKTHDIVPYGESLGAAVAAYTARKYNMPEVIIESGLPSIGEFMKAKLPYVSFLRFLFPEFNTLRFLDNYPGKTLVMHSINDEIIPYSSTEQLRNPDPVIDKRTPMVRGDIVSIDMDGSHNDPKIPWDEVRKFIGVSV